MIKNDEYIKKLMSKNGITSMLLAEELLLNNIGDRIETVEYYASKYNVGRGTVQYAITFLSELGAVKLESKGHKGTYLVDINYKKLLLISGIHSITASMPLPYSLRLEGLATGLYSVFSKCEMDFNVIYTRGSKNRLQQLKDGKVDFVIVSYEAARDSMEKDKDFIILKEFGPFSYVGQRGMIFRDKHMGRIEKNMRVAIDNSSYDQISITKKMCKDIDVDFVNVSYNQITNLLLNNEIDVAIWNGDEFLDRNKEMNIVLLDNIQPMDQQAVAVGLGGNIGLNSVIKKNINVDEVHRVQNQVIDKKIVPVY